MTTKRLLIAILDKNGHEIPDPVPMSLDVDMTRPPSVHELVRNLVRYEVSRTASAEGYESFEEADDFDIGDEPELRSQYELADEQSSATLREFVDETVPQPEPDEDVNVQLKPAPDEGKTQKQVKNAKAAKQVKLPLKASQKPHQEAVEPSDDEPSPQYAT